MGSRRHLDLWDTPLVDFEGEELVRLNCFSCASVRVLQDMLACVPTSRLKQMRHLDLSLLVSEDSHYVDFESMIKKLRAIRKLHSLNLLADGSEWFRMPKHGREALGRRSRFSSFRQSSGFRDLAVVGSRAEEWTFKQRSDTAFKEWMETEVSPSKVAGCCLSPTYRHVSSV